MSLKKVTARKPAVKEPETAPLARDWQLDCAYNEGYIEGRLGLASPVVPYRNSPLATAWEAGHKRGAVTKHLQNRTEPPEPEVASILNEIKRKLGWKI